MANAKSLANLKPIKPGETRNPGGKPTASRNRLTGDFVAKLAADFELHGKKAIVDAREKDPMGYVKTIASLLPKELEITRPLGELSDSELTAIAERLRSGLDLTKDRAGDSVTLELPTVN